MSESHRFSDSGAVAEDLEAEIDYYTSLTPEEVDAELRHYGIDPQPTIEAVTKLVKRRLSARATHPRHHAAHAGSDKPREGGQP